MSLKVFLLGLIAAYASDFLTLVTDMDRIQEDDEITCEGSADGFGRILLMVDGEVPGYRVASYCENLDFRVNGAPPSWPYVFPLFDGLVLYVCASGHTQLTSTDEICGFHDEGTTNSLHVAYKGAKVGDRVVFEEGGGLEFGFLDIYDGNDMSYGNFVGVFNPRAIRYNTWKFSVGIIEDFFKVNNARSNRGIEQVVTKSDHLKSYVYPLVPAGSPALADSFILSVGVFGTLKTHHCVHSCVKGAPDGYCMHSSSETFNKGGSDVLTMALPNDMQTYYFEYGVFKFSRTLFGGAYDRVIFMTSVLKRSMIDSFQKRVFFSNEVADGMFVATNLMTCHATLETCMNGGKKSFKLTLYGYTKSQQVQKLIVHGGNIVVKVEDKDCQEQNSQCIVTAELFAYRNTQMWIEDMKETHNGVIDPDDNYRAMIFQDITLVIEPAE